MKNIFRNILIVCIVIIVLMSTVSAEQVFSVIKVIEDSVRVYINNDEVNIDNIIYKDTVYVPLGVIAEKFGKNVTWDKETRIMKINDKNTEEPVENEKVEKEIVTVESTTEFLKAIGSNKTIILKENDYNISEVISKPLSFKNENIEIEEVFDGNQLVIENVENLDIIGEEGAKVQILVEPRYANIIAFNNVENLKISNIIAGHTPEKGGCSGGVLLFQDSKNIEIDKSELFGCGTEGLTIFRTEKLVFNNSIIKECANSIMSIYESTDITFSNSKFFDNEMYDLIVVKNTQGVKFKNSIIYNNKSYVDDTLFNVDSNSDVSIENTVIHNNKVFKLEKRENSIKTEDIIFGDNLFFVNKPVDNIKNHILELSDKDIEKAVKRGENISYLPFYEEYMINWVKEDGYKNYGVDINGNRSEKTFVGDVEIFTPFAYVERLAYLRHRDNEPLTLEAARGLYENYIDRNQLLLQAELFSTNPEDTSNAKALLMQDNKVIDLEIELTKEYFESLHYSKEINYSRFALLKISLDDIDFSKKAILTIWPNGDEEHIAEFHIDFAEYR